MILFLTFYVFEENVDSSRNDVFYKLLHEKKYKYKNIPIIAKDVEVKGVSVDKIPESLKGNLYLSTDLVMPENEKEKFRNHLKFYKTFTNKINQSRMEVIPKKRSDFKLFITPGARNEI